MASPVKPTNGRTTKIIRLSVSVIYILTPLALYVYYTYMNRPIDSTIFITVMAFAFASAYVIYGKEIVNEATGEVSDIRGEGNKEEDNK